MDIRPLTYADLPEVIAIERRAFPTPWSLAMFVMELSKRNGICLTAREDDTTAIAGYLVCSRYDDVWHLMNICVEPRRRRRGIGSAMLERLIDATGDPLARITLEVRTSNTSAVALYERYGFRSAGIRRRYYQDNGEDAVIMWRTPATLSGTLDDVPNAGLAG